MEAQWLIQVLSVGYALYKCGILVLIWVKYSYINNKDITHNCNVIYCILRGRIKGFHSSITTIMCQVGNYRNLSNTNWLP